MILPLLAALAAACLMTPVQAQTTGGYLGAGVMTVSTENARDFAAANATSGDGSSTGFKAYGGYLWPGRPGRLGIEFGYYDLGTYFSLRADLETIGGVTHSVGGLESDYGYGALSFSGQVNF